MNTKSIGNWTSTDFGGLGSTIGGAGLTGNMVIPQVTNRFTRSSFLDDKV